MFKILFLCNFLFCIYGINLLNGQVHFTLDSKAQTLYFDLRDLQAGQLLTVNVNDNSSFDMFVAGTLPSELANYLLYESDSENNNSFIGNLGNMSLFTNYNEPHIPLKYSTHPKTLSILFKNGTSSATNSVLYFRLFDQLDCNNLTNVIQPPEGINKTLYFNLTAPSDTVCQLTIITYKSRPRHIHVLNLFTTTTSTLFGVIYNQTVDYIPFNQQSIFYYQGLYLFGSIFNMNVAAGNTVGIQFYDQQNVDDPTNVIHYVDDINDSNVITSPDYGELTQYETLHACNTNGHPCKTTVIAAKSENCYLLQLMNRDNVDNETALYIIDSNNITYSLLSQALIISFWIPAQNFTVFYADTKFSNFRITYQLVTCDSYDPKSSTTTTDFSSLTSVKTETTTKTSTFTSLSTTSASTNKSPEKHFYLFLSLIISFNLGISYFFKQKQ